MPRALLRCARATAVAAHLASRWRSGASQAGGAVAPERPRAAILDGSLSKRPMPWSPRVVDDTCPRGLRVLVRQRPCPFGAERPGTAHPIRPPRPTRAASRAGPGSWTALARCWLATRRWSGGGRVRPAQPPTTSRPAVDPRAGGGPSPRRRRPATDTRPQARGICWPPTTCRGPGCRAQQAGHAPWPVPRLPGLPETLDPPTARIGIVLDNLGPHLSTADDPRVGDWAAANNVALATPRPTRAG
jgi:hypothetical protein